MNTKKPWYTKKKVWKWIGIVFLALFIIGKVSEITGYSDKLEAQKAEEKAAAEAEKDAKQKKIEAELTKEKEKEQAEQKAAAEKKANEEKTEKERLANRTIDEKIKDTVISVTGKKGYRSHKFDSNALKIQINSQGNFTKNMVLKGTYMDMLGIVEKIQKESLFNGADEVKIAFYTEFTDMYGKMSEEVLVEIGMNKDTISKIEFENVLHTNVPTLADYYWENPLFANN